MQPDAKLADAIEKCLQSILEGKSVDVTVAENTVMPDKVAPLLYTGTYVASLPKVRASEAFRRTAKGRLMARLHEETVLEKQQNSITNSFGVFFNGLDNAFGKFWQAMTGARRVAFPVALCLVMVLAIFIGSSNPFSSSATIASACTLSIVNGDVTIQPANSSPRVGADGMTLEAGTHVITSQDSCAVLTFFDGSTLTMEPDTDIEIQQLSSDEQQTVTIILKQWIGRTWSSVVKMADRGSRYQIDTPSAVALVRGTRFLVAVDDDGQTIEHTTQGLVSVSAHGTEVFVPAGQATTVEPGNEPSEPEDAPTPQAAPNVPAQPGNSDSVNSVALASVQNDNGRNDYAPTDNGIGNDRGQDNNDGEKVRGDNGNDGDNKDSNTGSDRDNGKPDNDNQDKSPVSHDKQDKNERENGPDDNGQGNVNSDDHGNNGQGNGSSDSHGKNGQDDKGNDSGNGGNNSGNKDKSGNHGNNIDNNNGNQVNDSQVDNGIIEENDDSQEDVDEDKELDEDEDKELDEDEDKELDEDEDKELDEDEDKELDEDEDKELDEDEDKELDVDEDKELDEDEDKELDEDEDKELDVDEDKDKDKDKDSG